MELEFLFDSSREAINVDNFNKTKIIDLLKSLEKKGVKITIHDTCNWDSDAIMKNYQRAILVSIRKKYAIRRVFGSARNVGWLFGKQVPALIVQENGHDIDVYPHKFGLKRVSILDFLKEIT